MAKTYAIQFNDPNYDLVISYTVNGKTYSESESFATLELATIELTAIKTLYQSEVTTLNSRIQDLNAEISAIDIGLG
jgi:hypothetical protein